jgi:dTDP-glucose pyrophosphorylase
MRLKRRQKNTPKPKRRQKQPPSTTRRGGGRGLIRLRGAPARDPSRYGVVVFNEEGVAERFVEKPKEYISDWALVGLYIFNDKVFDAVKRIKPSWRGELEITDTIQTLLQDGAKVDVQRVQGWWKDTGRPEDLLEANQLVLNDLEPYNRGTVEDAATITNSVGIGEGTIIHRHTAIRGPVVNRRPLRDRTKHLHRSLHKHRRQLHHHQHRGGEQHHHGRRPHRLQQAHR